MSILPMLCDGQLVDGDYIHLLPFCKKEYAEGYGFMSGIKQDCPSYISREKGMNGFGFYRFDADTGD